MIGNNLTGRIIPRGHNPQTGETLHSYTSISLWPAPLREAYFNTEDYVAACMRIYTKRMKFDGFIKQKRTEADNHKHHSGKDSLK